MNTDQFKLLELESTSDMYHRMMKNCFQNCIKKSFATSKDSNLTKEETDCDDNCVSKYLKANEIINQVFVDFHKAAQAGARL